MDNACVRTESSLVLVIKPCLLLVIKHNAVAHISTVFNYADRGQNILVEPFKCRRMMFIIFNRILK
jgi:hypothetical protein